MQAVSARKLIFIYDFVYVQYEYTRYVRDFPFSLKRKAGDGGGMERSDTGTQNFWENIEMGTESSRTFNFCIRICEKFATNYAHSEIYTGGRICNVRSCRTEAVCLLELTLDRKFKRDKKQNNVSNCARQLNVQQFFVFFFSLSQHSCI